MQIDFKKIFFRSAEYIGAALVILGVIRWIAVPWMADETFKRMSEDKGIQLQTQQLVEKVIKEYLLTNAEAKSDILLNIEKAYHNVAAASYGAYFFLEDTNEYVMPIYVPKTKNGEEREVKLHLIMAHYGPGKESLRKGKILINNEIELKNFDFSKIDHDQTTTWDLSQAIEDARKSGSYPDRDKSIFTVVFRPDPTQKTTDVVSVVALINVMGLSIDDAENPADVKQ